MKLSRKNLYKWAVCGFTSNYLEVMRIHLKMHAVEKSNKCNYCVYASYSFQFHNVLTSFAKRICDNLCEIYGPTNSKYINNDFITWINISAAKTNTKGLYEKILKCTYASSNLTAIKKLNKVPFLGTLNEKRICNAMHRITKAVNTARSFRASIEFCLGAF